MSFNISLESLMDLIGFTIGMFLGIGVLIYHWKQKSFIFLALFIIVYSLDCSYSFIDNLFGENKITNVLFSINLSWLLFPLFYVYVQHISTLKANDVKSPLSLALSFLVFEFIVNLFFSETLNNFPFFYTLIVSSEVVFSSWIAYKTFSWINKQKKEVYNYFSDVTDKELNWSRTYIAMGLVFTFFGYVVFLMNADLGWGFYVFNLINIVLLIWISIRSVFQFQIEKIVEKNKESKTIIEKKKLDETIEIVRNYIETSESYKIHNLTIIDVSKATNIHTKAISESINSILASNFNSFINQFRINEAKKMLKNTDFSNLSIEGIGQEVGFSSKSTFYRSFKKEIGSTPKEFLAQNSGKF